MTVRVRPLSKQSGALITEVKEWEKKKKLFGVETIVSRLPPIYRDLNFTIGYATNFTFEFEEDSAEEEMFINFFKTFLNPGTEEKDKFTYEQLFSVFKRTIGEIIYTGLVHNHMWLEWTSDRKNKKDIQLIKLHPLQWEIKRNNMNEIERNEYGDIVGLTRNNYFDGLFNNKRDENFIPIERLVLFTPYRIGDEIYGIGPITVAADAALQGKEAFDAYSAALRVAGFPIIKLKYDRPFNPDDSRIKEEKEMLDKMADGYLKSYQEQPDTNLSLLQSYVLPQTTGMLDPFEKRESSSFGLPPTLTTPQKVLPAEGLRTQVDIVENTQSIRTLRSEFIYTQLMPKVISAFWDGDKPPKYRIIEHKLTPRNLLDDANALRIMAETKYNEEPIFTREELMRVKENIIR